MPGPTGSEEHPHRQVPIPQHFAQEQCASLLPPGDRPPQGTLNPETCDWTGESWGKRKLTIMQEMTPLIYTPVVGEACQRWSEIYQQPEGKIRRSHELEPETLTLFQACT